MASPQSTPPRMPSAAKPARAAFTLIELMISVTLLMLLIVMVAQLTNSATIVTTSGRKRITADDQARMVFDRMATDIAGMVLRDDVDVICKGVPTASGPLAMGGGTGVNDVLYFFSRAPAYYSGTSKMNNNMALAGYRINTTGTSPHYGQMERLGKGLNWEGVPNSTGTTNGMAFLPNTSGTTVLTSSPGFISYYVGADSNPTIGTATGNFSDSADSDFHLISDSVFRFEYCYLLKPVAGTNIPARLSILPYDQLNQNHTSISGWRDVDAIVVTIALLDKESQKILQKTGSGAVDWSQYTLTALSDTVDGQDSLGTWVGAVNTSTFPSTSKLPKAAASQVRIYQRYFYLNKK